MMSGKSGSGHEELRRYLLGMEMTEAAQEAIELRYFTNDDYFGELAQEEDRLIEEHLRGELKGAELRAFEEHFLRIDRRRKRWEMRRAAREFYRSSTEQATWRDSAVRLLSWRPQGGRMAMAFGLVLLIGVAGGLLMVQRSRVVVNEGGAAKSEGGPVVATLILSPGVLRSSSGQDFQVPDAAGKIRLRLQVKGEGGNYTAALTTVEGVERWRASGLAATGGMVEAVMQARILTRGDYIVALSRMEAGGEIQLPSYSFRVVER